METSFVMLKDNSWLERQRIAGKCLSDIMVQLEKLVVEKTNLSLLEIDKFIGDEISKRYCTATFNGYKGFPANCCMSVNCALVHGIPTDYKLQDGDIITFDFGTTYKGAIADSATTLIFGGPKSKEHIRMIETTKECLHNAIKVVEIGKRIGVIGNAIYKTARDKGFRVIENYGGHGLEENTPHASPFISNKTEPGEGIRIQPGLTIAIEPLLVPYSCSTKTKTGTDGWTVYTEDISAHEEHTLYVHEDHIEVITLRENEQWNT